MVGKDYFEIHNQHLMRGRMLSPEDVFSSRKVVVVNQAFARKFLPKSEPLGQKIDFADYDNYLQHPPFENPGSAPLTSTLPAHTWFEVVGIVSDMKNPYFGPGGPPPQPEAFVPWTVAPRRVEGLRVRTSGNADRYSRPLSSRYGRWTRTSARETRAPDKLCPKGTCSTNISMPSRNSSS